MCVVLSVGSQPLTKPQHNTTQPGRDTEIHRLGFESHKHRPEPRGPEHTETVWESEMVLVSFASYTEVTVVRQSH